MGEKRAAPPSLHVRDHRTPHRLLKPTHMTLVDPAAPDNETEWTSRRARKGRYAPKARHLPHAQILGAEDKALERERTVYMRVKDTRSDFKPNLRADITFWLAVSFVFGSIAWVINGFFVWLPDVYPSLASTSYTNVAAAFAFIGGTVFELGSYLMVVEALDRGRETDFGTALGSLLHSRRRLPSYKRTEPGSHGHSRTSRSSSETRNEASVQNTDPAKSTHESAAGAQGFVWWGKPLWHDLGYLAAVIQLCAATVFWVSTVTGLPGVIPGFYEEIASVAIEDVFFWTPQGEPAHIEGNRADPAVIGGSGFIISSTLLMLEVQTHWWAIRPLDLGWQIAFWNLIGSIGFTLCGGFGYSPASGMVYESALSTFWGGWAFLIGSTFQLWEAIWREPQHQSSDTKGA